MREFVAWTLIAFLGVIPCVMLAVVIRRSLHTLAECRKLSKLNPYTGKPRKTIAEMRCKR